MPTRCGPSARRSSSSSTRRIRARLERALKAVERGGVPLITRDGIYAKLGSLTTGSGFAYGAGYRSRRFLDRDTGFDVWAGGA